MKDSQLLQPKASQPTQKKKIRKFKKKKQLTRPQQVPVSASVKKVEVPVSVAAPNPSTAPSRTWKQTVKEANYTQIFFLSFIPLILICVLVVLIIFNRQIEQRMENNTIRSDDSLSKVYPYPLVTQKLALPQLSAKAAIVTDADSQVILFAKNDQLRFSMASTTKIMTALVALDYFTPDALLTVQSSQVEGSGIGLMAGEQFRFIDLLYAMLLPSANDAAMTIAENYPGGTAVFVQKMNEKAASLHLSDTHFADPAGLDDDGDYTTVVDLARLAGHAMQNKIFAQVVGTTDRIITTSNGTRVIPLSNLNQLLGYHGVNGVKTGTTDGAGEVLVTSSTIKGHTYIIVIMNSTQRFVDTQALLSFIEDDVQYVDVVAFPERFVK